MTLGYVIHHISGCFQSKHTPDAENHNGNGGPINGRTVIRDNFFNKLDDGSKAFTVEITHMPELWFWQKTEKHRYQHQRENKDQYYGDGSDDSELYQKMVVCDDEGSETHGCCEIGQNHRCTYRLNHPCQRLHFIGVNFIFLIIFIQQEDIVFHGNNRYQRRQYPRENSNFITENHQKSQ